jgi:hypothetical protein
MKSSSRSSDVLHHSIGVAAEIKKFVDRLATWTLILALTAGAIIVVLWLAVWCNDSISLAGATGSQWV